jgi:hypothetical protein
MSERVPVFCGPYCIELADAARVKWLAKAPNARLIRRRKDHAVVEIQLAEAGDDSKKRERQGLKHLAVDTAPIFRSAVAECGATLRWRRQVFRAPEAA